MESIKLFTKSVPAMFFSWAVSRYLLISFINLSLPYPEGKWLRGDVDLYAYWSINLAKGRFPLNDEMWQYPPLAGFLFAVPKWIFQSGGNGFIALMLIFDLLILITLVKFRKNYTNSHTGIWFWLLWPFVMGPLIFTRFDLAPSLFALLALIFLDKNYKHSLKIAGFFLSVGTLLKLWPILILVIVPRKKLLPLFKYFSASSLLLLFLLFSWSGGFGNFFSNQNQRGLQVESVFALPFMIFKAFGADIETIYRFGSLEVNLDTANQIATLANWLTISIFLLLFILNYLGKFDHLLIFDKALVVIITAIFFSRVFSPQFYVWIGALSAMALLNHKGKSKTIIILLSVSALMTQVLYPALYVQYLSGEFWPVMIQSIRIFTFTGAVIMGWRLLLQKPTGKVMIHD